MDDSGGAGIRVLVIDDERIVADTIALILSSVGYEVAVAYGAEEAVEKAETWKPAVIISEVILSGMTGIEAVIQIGKRHPDCRVVLTSGQPDAAALLERAERQGWRFEVLAKPIAPEYLLTRLSGCAESNVHPVSYELS